MSTKYLNGENILRQVYDADAESLRTTAVATFSGGSISVSISHLTDSIKIGDGTDFLAINPDGSINAVISGTMNIEIDAADGDNIAISDGTDTLAINADGSINVAGVATEVTLSAVDAKLGAVESAPGVSASTAITIQGNPGGLAVPVDVSNFPATQAVTQSGTWNINDITGTISLPTGAATETTLNSVLTAIQSIDSDTPPLGQALMAASIPVTMASDQTGINMSGTDNGTDSGTKFTLVNNRRQQILAAKDRNDAVTYADFGTKNERITQIDYTSATIGAFTARKTVNYVLDGSKYKLTNIVWTLF